MVYDFFIASSWSNRDQVIQLATALREKGYKVFTFLDKKENFTVPVAEAMKNHPNLEDWRKHKLFKSVFDQDMEGLKILKHFCWCSLLVNQPTWRQE